MFMSVNKGSPFLSCALPKHWEQGKNQPVLAGRVRAQVLPSIPAQGHTQLVPERGSFNYPSSWDHKRICKAFTRPSNRDHTGRWSLQQYTPKIPLQIGYQIRTVTGSTMQKIRVFSTCRSYLCGSRQVLAKVVNHRTPEKVKCYLTYLATKISSRRILPSSVN
jgi:hypothetical protein